MEAEVEPQLPYSFFETPLNNFCFSNRNFSLFDNTEFHINNTLLYGSIDK